MAGYIGKSQGVTQVDGYNRSEADAEFVNDPNDVITVSGGNVGVGTVSPSTLAHLKSSGDFAALTIETATTGGASYINLGDSNDQDVGQIAYYNSDDSLRVKVNAAERMRIDSAGRVTMPYQPAFLAYSNLGQGTTTGAGQVLPFDLVGQRGGSHFNTSTYRFTAPVFGWYYFVAQIYKNGTSTANRFRISKNGSSIFNANINHTQLGTDHTAQHIVLVDMAANDYVDVRQDDAGTINFWRGHSTFMGYLVG